MKRFLIFTLLSVVFVLPSKSQYHDSIRSRIVKPYYGGAHFAGNTGLISLSFGRKFSNDRLTLGIGYGYLPENVNGTEVHTLFLKTTYFFSKGLLIKKVNWYLGLTSLYALTNNTFVRLPSQYPDDYYRPTALHLAPYLGVRIPFLFYKPVWAKNVFFQTEIGVLDSYLWYSIINKHIQFWDIYNVSFGIYYDI